jgi:hypothetical protein
MLYWCWVSFSDYNGERPVKKLAYLIISLLLLASSTLFAGWSEPMQLTHRGFEMNPQIIAVGDTLHVAWTQIADSQNVSYMRSIDGGQSWGEIINLNSQPYGGRILSLTRNEDRIFIGWLGGFIHGQLDIIYSISQDGISWTQPARAIRGNTTIDGISSATLGGDSIYAVYYAYGPDSTGNIPFRFLYSSDLGQSWSNEQTVAYAWPDYCNGLIIKKCQGILYIVWNAVPVPESTEHTTWETQVIDSHDGGLTWSPTIFLSQNGGSPAQTACASCNPVDGSFAVGWMDYNYPGRFYIRITNDSGYNWGQEIQNVTGHYISDPAIDFVGDTLWATWTDWDFSDHRQIGYSKSTNLGQNWTESERISYTTGWSMTPWLSYDNGKVHLVWQEEDISAYSDIYYCRWESGDYITETQNPSSHKLTCYPNPFNSAVAINFKNIKGGEIQIYDISGRLIKSLPVKDRSEGSVIWDAKDGLGQPLASGIYIAKLKTTRGVCTAKLVYLK